MQKVRKSAHCIQLITPQERFISQLSNDDSSVDGESSGDEIAPNDRVDNANRKKEPPTAREIRARRRARGERRKEIDDMMKNMPPRRDLLVLEYMPNGDLFALIQRLAKHRREHGALLGGIIPNRVLWSFWLCLIRACIAMEYPPRKFQQGESDLVETIPENVNRRQNLVHFDIDPSNVFIGDLELSKEGEESRKETHEKDETTRRHLGRDISIGLVRPIRLTASDRRPCGHEFVPKLKLADFGVADKIKLMKRK
ncbi:hypothetical protein F4821DRAFT_259426 [Hypoxylon rubiginosum]|uniref:Uncharacterized protein n=1 Tax=Hypoxylon rubiginosum TaxID=110542 RepID=A0ACC0D3K2_9PEZI|nr:hypothetical protein F4821DRAFT_259426 [Hypoxylon rubiginosum]